MEYLLGSNRGMTIFVDQQGELEDSSDNEIGLIKALRDASQHQGRAMQW